MNAGPLLVRIRATPGARVDRAGGAWIGPDGDRRLVVRVAAPPEDGRANAAIEKLIARTVGAPRSAVKVVAGETSRLKTIAIAGESEPLRRMIEMLMGEDA